MQRRENMQPRPHSDRRIQQLRRAFQQGHPRLAPESEAPVRAAVALLLRRAAEDLEILLILRPERDEDPWSGHTAFPGGRREPGESDVDAAVRETWEEVGIRLDRVHDRIGRLDDVRPLRGGPQIAVAAFVFVVPDDVVVHADPREVADTMWIPLGHLADPSSAAEHMHPIPGTPPRVFPAFTYRDRVIWGLTYRMLSQFLEFARTLADKSDLP